MEQKEVRKEEAQIQDLISQVRKLVQEIPGISIEKLHDPDTFLADVVEKTDCSETGIAEEVFGIWENSSDKKSVEELFHTICGVAFKDYLAYCVNNTYRAGRKECD